MQAISYPKEDSDQRIGYLLRVCETCKNAEEAERCIKQTEVSPHIVFVDTTDPEQALQSKKKHPSTIILSHSLNDVRHMNTLFSNINNCLENEGRVICHCTTTDCRKEKILKQYPAGINFIIFFLDYCWSRIIPKTALLNDVYYKITKSKNRALHRVEVLGKLYRAGFEVLHEEMIHGVLYVVASKCKEPVRIRENNTGLLICLKRIGKNGKEINIYKFRTMHAYSEYLQSYVYGSSTLVKGDKISNDYRVTVWGKFMRKYWIDELPQLVNLIKGDIKLVGVRPLSCHKFSLYDKELQALRIKTKPGLVPPYYADMPDSLEGLEESERKYLESYMKRPFHTDCKYFWLAFRNIVIKGKRSR